ncbi:hypothetical protein GOV12_06180 [Candidatus Pacearchaeota archaeon]|nr:hypothetical protein [Candidatus Pacearchaeota archaeon]
MDVIIILFGVILLIGLIIAYFIGLKFGEFRKNREWERNVPGIRKDSVVRSRAVLSGQFSEQLAPILPGFKYNPSDCRFIGKPIDFIVFNGLGDGELKDIVFLEVKTGESRLNNNQKEVKKKIEEGRVFFDEFRV